MRTVLLLGGTGEARKLAAALHVHVHVISSLAGRVKEPRLPEGEVRIGGFGGAEGFRKWLLDHHIDVVVDATHPFAARMTQTAATVTKELGIPFLVLRRPGWTQQAGDDWRWVADTAEAARSLKQERVFLTTGREELYAFAHLDNWFLVRSVEPPEPPTPQRMHVILDRGPFTVDNEKRLITDHRIDVLVTKDSGGDMTAAKLTAARDLHVPVVIIRRPAINVDPVTTVDEVVRWLGIDGG
ncbi:cobalt-precorrin-6A reductase [Kibdelosporangium lantanae]|uniref:Cobalt-precorrin-6A reductase n=1 Tax=Kibdelosporangium lantanae TaxID=1497396 RepID=A0ABW3M5G3_9PSEU